MRATKVYIASLGTTGLLLASAGSLLIVVGALFAFNGWPGAQVSDSVDSVVLEEKDRPFRVSVAQSGSDGGSAPRGSRQGGSTGAASDGGQGNTHAAFESSSDSQGDDGNGNGDAGSGGGSGSGGGGDGGGPRQDPPPVDTGGPKDQLADATEGATRDVGNAVDGVSPGTGQNVADTGKGLADTVRDLPDVQAGAKGVKVVERRRRRSR